MAGRSGCVTEGVGHKGSCCYVGKDTTVGSGATIDRGMSRVEGGAVI